MKIGLLNLDVGNIRSVYNVLKKISNNIELIDKVEEYDDKDVIFGYSLNDFLLKNKILKKLKFQKYIG